MTYDQWKARDPNDKVYVDPVEEGSELEEVYLALAEAQLAARLAAEVKDARIAQLAAALHECLEYFKDRYDVVDGFGSEDRQLPNREMKLGQMIEITLHGIPF